MDDSQKKSENVSLNWFDRVMQRLFGVVTFNTSGKAPSKARTKDVLTLYGKAVAQYPITLCVVMIFTVLASLLGLIVPIYYKEFFDIASSGPQNGETGDKLLTVIYLILGINLAIWVSKRTFYYGMVRLAREVMIDLRIQAFDYLIHHSQHFFASTFTGGLVQKVGRYQKAYDRIADSIIFHVIPTIILVVGVIIVLQKENWILAVLTLIWIVLVAISSYAFSVWKLKYDVLRAKLDSRVTGITADILSNHPAVEAHGAYDIEKERHGDIARTQMRTASFTWSVWQVFHSVQELSVIGIQFLSFFIGIIFWMKGDFSLGTFMLLHVYVFQITERIWNFGNVIRDVYESVADAKEMTDILQTPHDIRDSAKDRTVSDVCGQIDFVDTQFSYGGKLVIQKLNHTIMPGERVGIVGPSGAGKTTLMKLLPRIMDVTGGTISVDGRDIRTLTLESLRDAMSIVPQDPVLFHRSLLENIRYGKPNASDDEVIEAAKAAHCHEFISQLPYGYNTLVGERGIKLSGGERQRVAIARAFLRNAPILILDESTSSLDSESESYIQESLARLMENRTTIVIAHRLATIRHLDRILVLQHGSIVEQGTHTELILQNGLYTKLWNLQQDGFMHDDIEEAA